MQKEIMMLQFYCLSLITLDLGKLNNECRKLQTDLDVLQGICESLTPFGTVTRYPGSSMKVGPEHLPLVLSWTKKIREIIRIQLKLS